MAYLIVMVCVIYIIIQLIMKEKIYKPAIMLAALWGIILFVYSFRAFQLPCVSSDIYIIILVGLLCFFVGSLVAKYLKITLVIGKYTLYSREIRLRAYNIVTFLFFIVMLLPFIRAVMFLFGGSSLYMIRYSLQNDILGSGLIAILFNYFCEPYLTFMIVYSISNLFSEKRNAYNLLVTIIGIVFMTIISGGRFFILYFIGALIVMLMIYKGNIKREKRKEESKVLQRIKLLIIVGIVGIIAVSLIRGTKLGETAYVYLCGGIPFLEYLKETLIQTKHTHGAATMYGFVRPFFVVLRKIGICNLPVWLQNIENIYLDVDNAYFLAPGILFNSFSTSFFAPYLDGGLFGIIIVYVILGFISENAYRKINQKNEYIIAYFLLIALIVVLSFFRLLITHYSFALAFVYLYLMSKPMKKNEYI